jgi:hypothetical protein
MGVTFSDDYISLMEVNPPSALSACLFLLPYFSLSSLSLSLCPLSSCQAMLQVDYTLRPGAEEVKERIKYILDEQGGY